MAAIATTGLIRWSTATARADRAAVITCNSAALPFAAFLADGLVRLDPADSFDTVIAVTDGDRPDPGLYPGVRLLGLDIGTHFDALPESRQIPRITYSRLLLPAALPEYQRILYLDADILPRRSGVAELLAAEPPAVISMAPDYSDYVRDPLPRRHDIWRNAGVLLIDADRARTERVMERVLDFAVRNVALLKQHDQTALNLGLKGELGLLSPRWNWMDVGTVEPYIPALDPVLIHFVSHPKPWDWHEGNPRMRYFDDYARFLAERFGTRLEKTSETTAWTELNAGYRMHRSWLREQISLLLRKRRLRRKGEKGASKPVPSVPESRLRQLAALADL